MGQRIIADIRNNEPKNSIKILVEEFKNCTQLEENQLKVSFIARHVF